MESIEQSWATAGYLGAISSGETTCGLLIGSSVAIGLRVGEELEELPLEKRKEREKAVAAVHMMYEDFLHEFKETQCKKLIDCDLSQDGELKRYEEEKIYEKTCFKQFDFIMNRFIELDKQGRLQ